MRHSGRRNCLAAVLAAVTAFAAGCGVWEEAAPAGPRLPSGAWLFADGPAFERLLASVAELQGSAAGRIAGELRGPLGGCDEVLAHAAEPAALLGRLRCLEPGEDVPAGLRQLRGEAQLALLLPLEPEGSAPLRATAQVGADGSLDASISFAADAVRGFAKFAVPAARSAGPARLSAARSLIHARLRPSDGFDLLRSLGAFADPEGTSDWRRALLAGAALEGTWELAVYPPRAGQRIPPIALGLELAMPAAARAGVDRLVAALEMQWPLEHREAAFELAEGGSLRGACFLELRLLPDFAPCWAVRGDLLVVGWNAFSLQAALAPDPEAPREVDGLVMSLDRWPEAERLLGGSPPDYAWRTVALHAGRRGGDVTLALRADSAGARR